MFCRACESLVAVYNIKNGQPNRSAMERPHSGRGDSMSPISLTPTDAIQPGVHAVTFTLITDIRPILHMITVHSGII